jgi:hypothetical protein
MEYKHTLYNLNIQLSLDPKLLYITCKDLTTAIEYEQEVQIKSFLHISDSPPYTEFFEFVANYNPTVEFKNNAIITWTAISNSDLQIPKLEIAKKNRGNIIQFQQSDKELISRVDALEQELTLAKNTIAELVEEVKKLKYDIVGWNAQKQNKDQVKRLYNGLRP